jgi:hypothetical protein
MNDYNILQRGLKHSLIIEDEESIDHLRNTGLVKTGLHEVTLPDGKIIYKTTCRTTKLGKMVMDYIW